MQLQTQIMMRSIGKKPFGESGKFKNVMKDTNADPWFRDTLERYEDTLCFLDARLRR